MKNYYRVMLGRKSILAAAAHAGGYICPDVEIPQDLSPDLGDVWRAFNKKFVPIFMASHSDKTKIGAGLACGALWTVKGLLVKNLAQTDLGRDFDIFAEDGCQCVAV